jgi:hypothetical protein
MVFGSNYKKIKPQQLIWAGFVLALILFTICIISRPESLGHNDGLSYFGAVWWTVIPYSVAFLSYGTFCWLASNKIAGKSHGGKIIKWFLRLMAVVLVGLILTPHTIINPIHKTFGSTLFASQLLLSMYLFYKNPKQFYVFILIIIMFASGLFSAAFLFSATGFMIQAQIIYQFAFVILLTQYLKILNKLK